MDKLEFKKEIQDDIDNGELPKILKDISGFTNKDKKQNKKTNINSTKKENSSDNQIDDESSFLSL